MSMRQVLTLTIGPDETDVRLDRWMKRHFHGLTQGQVEKLCRTGQVRVDGARVKPNTRLLTGQTVRIPPLPDAPTTRTSEDSADSGVPPRDRDFIRKLVVYEDDDMLALNKPHGIPVQGGTGTTRHIDRMLPALQSGEHAPRLVHRLDRDTSGVLLIAKTPAAAARLGKLFRSRDMDKVYWAVTVGVPNPPAGQLRSWMVKDTGPAGQKEKMRLARHGEPGAVHAVTDYAVISQAAQRAAWVALKPQTGRTHQLRVHMEQVGTGILGDPKYLPTREVPQGLAPGLHLHARALIVPRASGRPITIVADLPEHMRRTFDGLGFLQEEAGKDPLAPFA